ncbi:MAG: SRPBCC family protein [Myxococcota bacterium]
MRILTEIHVDATPDACWEVLGCQFGDIAGWAAAILKSKVDREPEVGAKRECTVRGLGGFGDMNLHEELIEYDEASRRLAYRVNSGLPKMIVAAENHWEVRENSDGTSTITSRAELRVAWYMAIMTPMMKVQMGRDIACVGEELKHRIERGVVHPRKSSAMQVAVA